MNTVRAERYLSEEDRHRLQSQLRMLREHLDILKRLQAQDRVITEVEQAIREAEEALQRSREQR